MNSVTCTLAVLLNSPPILERIFKDEFIVDIIGALECKWILQKLISQLSDEFFLFSDYSIIIYWQNYSLPWSLHFISSLVLYLFFPTLFWSFTQVYIWIFKLQIYGFILGHNKNLWLRMHMERNHRFEAWNPYPSMGEGPKLFGKMIKD
jgi:hypothetical protein